MDSFRKLTYKDGFWATLFLLPNLIGFAVFTLWPVAMAFILSLCNYDILTPMEFVGIDNYINLAKDETFRQVLWNTIVFTVGTVPIGIIISLFLAVALNQNIRGIRFYRAAYFIPVISSMVAIAMLWQWLYNPEFGLLNYLLKFIGIKGPEWLTDPNWALPAVMIASVWKNLGYNMLLFLAGLQNISDSYYEAADIDGGSWWAKFTNITIPLLSPTTFFVSIMSIIQSFQVFDLVNLMTAGGPGRSTSVVVHYLYQNAFLWFKMGYASAQAYILFAIVMIITIVQLWYQKKTTDN